MGPPARRTNPADGFVSSVADLAAMRTWTVTAGTKGHCHTAERTIDTGGRRWTVGLTPTAAGATALILWSDDDVVRHLRGPDQDMVRTTCRWAMHLLNGQQPPEFQLASPRD